MNTTDSETCLLCNSERTVAESCGMLRCRTCRFFFLGRQVRREQQSAFHKRSQESVDEEKLAAAKNKYPKGAHPKRGLYEMYAKRLSTSHQGSVSALDVGASGGFFLKALELEGASAENLHSLEVEPTFVQLTKDYYGYQGALGNIETYTTSYRYTLITMFDVLEHVDDFWQALRNIHNLLDTNGRLFLKLPNGRWAYFKYHIAKLFGLRSKIPIYLHIRPGGHLNYWDVHTLPLLQEAGFEMELFEYVKPTKQQFGRSFPLRIVGYWLDRVFHTHLFPEMVVIFKKK